MNLHSISELESKGWWDNPERSIRISPEKYMSDLKLVKDDGGNKMIPIRARQENSRMSIIEFDG